jgi:two-component system sensor histidine kinase KdpD
MRKRDELRATLLAAIAHEFRTPLTAIKGAATELLASTESRADAELLSILDEEADHMNRLLAEAIELGRVESEKLQLQRVPTAVSEILQWADHEFRAAVRVAVRPLDAGLESQAAKLDVEPERIRQVLRQLVGNALKYSPSGTPVLIAAEVRETDAVLTVRDSGQGIQPDEIDRIFDPGFRGQRAAASGPGDGMGLAIARSLVEAHGGRIWVESYPEQGSSFSFSAPLRLVRTESAA